MLDTKQITICEVGTRDGFQIEPEFIPTSLKIEAVNRLSAVGIPPRLSHKNFTRLSNASNLLGQSAKSSSAS